MVSQATWLLLIGLLSFTSTTEPTKTKHNAPPQEFIDQCTPVPTWTVGGEQAISLVGQNISVIALLNSSRPFGRQQAGMLSSLRSRLYDAGFPSINFMVIDSVSTAGTDLMPHEGASIPVYQEQPGETVREILGAGNDHILVLDRCGRMAYQVITPFSKLTNPYVKAAILSTYKDNPCGFCNITNEEIQNPYYVAENDTMIYASDAPHQAKSKSEFSCDSATTLTIGAEQESCDESDETVEGESPNRENELTRSFFQNTGVQRPQAMTEMYENASHQFHAENVPLAEKRDFSQRAESVNLALLAQGRNESVLHDSQLQQPHIVQGHFGLMRNWDWSENQNTQSSIVGLEESAEQSVEVVLQVKHSNRKKKKKGIVKDCAPPEQCQGESSGSYEASDASMEKLVNETQLLIDWYQQQNGTSSEEKYEISDIVKTKIIEHYRRLWPWLNYRLAP